MSDLTKDLKECLRNLRLIDATRKTIIAFLNEFFAQNEELKKALALSNASEEETEKIINKLAEQLLRRGIATHEYVFTDPNERDELFRTLIANHFEIIGKTKDPHNKVIPASGTAYIYTFFLELRLIQHPFWQS